MALTPKRRHYKRVQKSIDAVKYKLENELPVGTKTPPFGKTAERLAAKREIVKTLVIEQKLF